MGSSAGETGNAHDRDPVAPAIGAAAGAVPWPQIVRFHSELAGLFQPEPPSLDSPEAGRKSGGESLQQYQQLDALLTADPQACGGLRLLEPSARARGPEASGTAPEVAASVLSGVPLDDSQRLAVRRGLRRDRLTVIEGRAGSGKTEVALALLLNAWAQGRSALLVGACESTVEAVFSRLERLGLQAPISARIGPGWRRELPETLRRLMQLVHPKGDGGKVLPDLGAVEAQRRLLGEDRARLAEALDTGLPEGLRAAAAAVIAAQSRARERLDALEADRDELRAEQERLGLGAMAPETVEPALNATRRWLDRMADYREQARDDGHRRAQLAEDTRTQERQRDQSVAEAGMSASAVPDWDWLLDRDWSDRLADWERRFAALLAEPLEAALAPLDWRPEYGRWRSPAEAESWAAEVRMLAGSARQHAADLERELGRTRDIREDLERQRVKIRGLGLPEDFDPNTDRISDWLDAHRQLIGHRPGFLDVLPWSAGARLRRRVRRLERQLLPLLPPAVHTSVGTLDPRGRVRLASVLEAAQRWSEIQKEQAQAWAQTEPQRAALDALRPKAAELGLAQLPVEHDPEAWVQTVARLEQEAGLADHAFLAWARRDAREDAREALRAFACEWALLTPRAPLLEAWRLGPGRAFDQAVRMLAVQPDAASVAQLRHAVGTGLLSRLRQVWQSAANHEHSARRLRAERAALPETAAHRDAWLKTRPAESLLEFDDEANGAWPDTPAALVQLDRIADWCVRWRFFQQEDETRARQYVDGLLAAATAEIEGLLRQLPTNPESARMHDLLRALRERSRDPLPEAELWEACSAFSREALGRRVESIDWELKRGLLDRAQARWLDALRSDADALRAAGSLGEPADGSGSWEADALEPAGGFRALLRALPLWITDVRGIVALPMEAGLFDLLIIEDAPQVTVNAMLPAIFRARSVVVTGDPRTAPAGQGAGTGEQAALAERLDVTGWLARLGFGAGDPVFRAAAVLARSGEDRLVLAGSYRAHPEILAFSSRLLYPYQPVPRSVRPGCGRGSDDGGLEIIDVPGRAEPGPEGGSWVNPAEAARVVEQVRDLRRRAPASSLAVITPFRAQRDRLRDELQDLESDGGLTIDLPRDAQGREWDCVVFSPVVARGMSADARRRLDRSPDLFAVVLTRAREALHVIGDLEFCREQEDMLQAFAEHCQELCRLRQDCPDAEGLFTAMLLAGWIPEVQPCIGDIRVDLALEAGPGRRLAIEVDGGEVRHGSARARAREAYLECMGYRLLRLQGTALQEDLSPAMTQIRSRLE